MSHKQEPRTFLDYVFFAYTYAMMAIILSGSAAGVCYLWKLALK